jgi:predicted AlkP superfamily phosphohydrolase/phosphomutase
VLGFDGAGWETIDPLIEAGELPFLERLRSESAWGPLHTFKPTKSPVIWTSIATGKSMTKHGILDFVYLRENGLPIPYRNSERREPSIWQILDHFGKRSVVVNWFVTYPPDPIDGVMISNRFRKSVLLPPERRERMTDTVHPPGYFEQALSFVDSSYEDVRVERKLPDLPSVFETVHPGSALADETVLKDYWVYVVQDALTERLSRHLYETEDFDFFAAYFRLPDIVQHMALRLLDPRLVEETLEGLARGTLTKEQERKFREELSRLLLPYYRYMERILEAYMSAPGSENTYFFLLSDHGFSLHAGGYDHYHVPPKDPAPSGIFLMAGPEVRGAKTAALSVYDVAPTILYLFDLPSGSEMDGRPATQLLDLEREVRYRRYGRGMMTEVTRKKEDDLDRELDENTLRELKSLGYIR